ncbi:MAG: L-serine ammonia-lyase, iron-sulfur-dependent subunit beta [Lachnospirales bacterium]
MNIFDIVGPIMIGPSSSHTAGVVRIGQVINRVCGGIPESVNITFYGSFSKTYKGHGSDRAILGGLLGFNTWDENIKFAFDVAKIKNMNFQFNTSNENKEHPNTIKILAIKNGITTEIIGVSVGGGNILIKNINGLKVEINCEKNTILINHLDYKGVVMKVSKILFENNINIATMNVFREEKRGKAIMVIEVDESINEHILEILLGVEFIEKSILIPSQ